MNRDVECNQPNAIFGFIYLTLAGKLFLQVCALVIGQILGNPLKPFVDGTLVDIQIRYAFFIKQWRDGFIFYGTLHGVGVQDWTKLVCRLVVF